MKSFAPLLVCAACLAGMPATAGTLATSDNPIVFAGAKFCVPDYEDFGTAALEP